MGKLSRAIARILRPADEEGVAEDARIAAGGALSSSIATSAITSNRRRGPHRARHPARRGAAAGAHAFGNVDADKGGYARGMDRVVDRADPQDMRYAFRTLPAGGLHRRRRAHARARHRRQHDHLHAVRGCHAADAAAGVAGRAPISSRTAPSRASPGGNYPLLRADGGQGPTGSPVVTWFTSGAAASTSRPEVASETARSLTVSGNYYDVLGVPMAIGRGFSSRLTIVRARTPLVAVISEGLLVGAGFGRTGVCWAARLTIDGRPTVVVGVTAAGFSSLDPGHGP